MDLLHSAEKVQVSDASAALSTGSTMMNKEQKLVTKIFNKK
jgi:hypothetical protein